jgi:hypothetical protein
MLVEPDKKSMQIKFLDVLPIEFKVLILEA